MKSKRKGTNDLVSLKVCKSTPFHDYSIACSMNSCFSSVFTVEDYANLSELDYVVDDQLENIHSTCEVVKHLETFNLKKSLGSDYIPLCILQICANVCAITVLLNRYRWLEVS